MSEKALSIATYCVASGAYVIMGARNPISGSEGVQKILSEGWEQKVGGKLEFVVDEDVECACEEIVRRSLEHIDKKRAELGLAEYDPSKWGRSGDQRMPDLLSVPFEERIEAIYGASVGKGG
jgi:carbon-monoxide dehydrogenase catalytic subunit